MKHEKITPQLAAMYLGQKCTFTHPTTGNEITFRIDSVDLWQVGDGDRYRAKYGEFVLHLRSMESLTEAEAKEIYELFYKTEFPDNYPKTAVGFFVARFEDNEEYPPTVFLYLLGKGFDLFQLIKNGIAKSIK